MAIDTTRQLIQQIANASQIGENTAARVGGAMEAMLNDVKAADDKAAAATNRINTTEQGIANANQRLTTEEGINAAQSAQIEGLKRDLQNIRPVTIEGDVVNNPDNVFLTSSNDEITPKERTTSLSAKGHYIMRPTDNFAAKLKANYIHEIPFDVDLGGASVTIPAGAVLKFTGGKIANGSLVLQNTYLDGDVKLSADVAVSGTCANPTAHQSWFVNNDIDAWHRFVNGVDCSAFAYTQGAYNATVLIDKEVADEITIHGNGAKLNFSYSQPNLTYYHIKPKDMTQTIVALSSAAYAGDLYVEVSSAEGLAVGDVVAIQDITASSYSYARNYVQGEFAKIKLIVGNKIYFCNPLFGTYRHVTTSRLIKFKRINANIDNLSINLTSNGSLSGTSNKAWGLYINQASGRLENVVANEFTDGITGNWLYNFEIEGCECRSYYNSTGDNYGVSLVNVQNVVINGGTFYGGNHGISFGSSYGGGVICRMLTVQNVHAESFKSPTAMGGINTHASTEFAQILNNISTGLSICGNKSNIIGNNVAGIINVSELITFEGIISGNKCGRINVVSWPMGTNTYPGATTDNWIPQTDKETMLIDGNICESITVTMTTEGDYPNSQNVVIDVRNNTIDQAQTDKDGNYKNISGSIFEVVPMSAYNNITGATGSYAANSAKGGTVLLQNNTWYHRSAAYICAKNLTVADNRISIATSNIYAYVADRCDILRNDVRNNGMSSAYRSAIQLNRDVDFVKVLNVIGNINTDIAMLTPNSLTPVPTKTAVNVIGNIYTGESGLTQNYVVVRLSGAQTSLAYERDNKLYVRNYYANFDTIVTGGNFDAQSNSIVKPTTSSVNRLIDLDAPSSGATTARPTLTANNKGYQFFDTTLNLPVWWTGSAWVKSDGTSA